MVMSYGGVILIVWGLLDALGMGMTVRLTRRVWRHENTGLKTKAVASMLAAASLYGAFQALLGVLRALSITGVGADPSRAAAQLAQGISQAMNCTAFALVIGVPSAVAAWFITRPRSTR